MVTGWWGRLRGTRLLLTRLFWGRVCRLRVRVIPWKILLMRICLVTVVSRLCLGLIVTLGVRWGWLLLVVFRLIGLSRFGLMILVI